MLLLGIETSCDETATAVVRDGRAVLSNVIYTQTAHHRPYGGVVPEIACRCHVEVLPDLIEQALRDARVGWEEIDGVAVTRGPGLATSLLVGFSAAQALALRLGRPLLPVNHLEGHVYSVFLPPCGGGAAAFREPADHVPLLLLTVSGGHTCLVWMPEPGAYRLLGQTLDDAAGEALDKGSKLLGLGYPGGPAIEAAARGGDPCCRRFPRGLERGGAAQRFDFSFSGLKTSLMYHLKNHPQDIAAGRLSDLAASYQEAVVDALVDRVARALDEHPAVALGAAGGVARNRRLRERLAGLAAQRGLRLLLTEPEYCTDNAAMIAAVASLRPGAGPAGVDIDPNLGLDTVPHQDP